MVKLLMDYDKERERKIEEFKDKHKKMNLIGMYYLSNEDIEKLEKLKFDLSDVWVYTDEEHWNAKDFIDNKQKIIEKLMLCRDAIKQDKPALSCMDACIDEIKKLMK